MPDLFNYVVGLASQLQASFITDLFRTYDWFYPLINILHLFGMAILFGALVPLDLRMMGLWRSIPLYELARVLVRVALAGGILAIASGVFLLAVKAKVYVDSPIFWAKAGFLILALINAITLRFVTAWRYLPKVDSRGTISRFRWAGFISLFSWSSVIICGRYYGYF
ncbi:hypothetical protein [Flexibacterium corallicola]|uniref:hypothetical protein n=1 Tax=Flexibacterium corallicola TaxID=3037259 RepID=UPI00286F00EE|nr:hypothetical protein [Pseudovibrio sp. M1P-2-3]